MAKDLEHEARYFEEQKLSNEEFWRRFGRRPDVTGKAVLDIGCGHGALSQALAQDAASVLGIDVDAEFIEFARDRMLQDDPGLADRLEFRLADLPDLGLTDAFDLAVSKDTFEHVADVPAMLRAVQRALKPGGELWVGFSPLYWSPWGDHGRAGLKLPWAHALLPQRAVLAAAGRVEGTPVHSLEDIGLNGMTPAQFRSHATAAGLSITSVTYNPGDRPLLSVLGRVRMLPGLERWATVGVYAVLTRH
jgi:SAM-dependent methyltransferase